MQTLGSLGWPLRIFTAEDKEVFCVMSASHAATSIRCVLHAYFCAVSHLLTLIRDETCLPPSTAKTVLDYCFHPPSVSAVTLESPIGDVSFHTLLLPNITMKGRYSISSSLPRLPPGGAFVRKLAPKTRNTASGNAPGVTMSGPRP